MKLPRDLAGEVLAQALCREFGYVRIHQSGSHIILQTESPAHHRFAVPAHAALRLGTLNAIVRAVAVAQAIEPITNCEPNMTRSDALLLSDALPKTTPALLNLLDMCGAEVQKLIEGRQFGFIYQPTMLGKDIALALEGHVTELPEPRRVQAADGIRRTVLSAWQLDMYGDLGNQDKLTEAYNLFAAAVAAIKSAYAAKP